MMAGNGNVTRAPGARRGSFPSVGSGSDVDVPEGQRALEGPDREARRGDSQGILCRRSRASGRGLLGGVTALWVSLSPVVLLAEDRGFDAQKREDSAWLVRVLPGSRAWEVLRSSGAERLWDGWFRVRLAPGGPKGGPAAPGLPGWLRTEVERRYRIDVPRGRPLPEPEKAGAASAGTSVPNDPLFPEQWHHRKLGAGPVWDHSDGRDVRVAIVDTGVDSGAPDLACAPVVAEYDAIEDREAVGAARDSHGHGTFIAAVVAQCAGNGRGGVGLSPGAKILAVRACSPDGECRSADVARGIRWAVDRGARVINLSLGMPCPGTRWPECSTEIENEALAYAAKRDVLVVGIAGNAGSTPIGFPANHPDVLGVTSTGATDFLAPYSNFGEDVALAAPGGELGVDRDADGKEDGILQETLAKVCLPFGSYAHCRWAGTSFAAPHVAAAAALLRSAYPQATRYQVRRALLESARDRGQPGFDPLYGHGMVDPPAALGRLAQLLATGAASCFESPERLCLSGERFAVEISWRDHQGRTGRGQALRWTRDSGLFWFFGPDNLEVLVKVLDGCGYNGRYWVYAAGTTDVEYVLRVTDTVTGGVREYSNPLGRPAPATTDSAAFLCGP